MVDHRFVIDERALDLREAPETVIADAFEALVDQLESLRGAGEAVGLLAGWGAAPCFDGADVATVLTSGLHCQIDLGRLLLRLLGKTVAWDDDPSVALTPAVLIADQELESYGIAWALSCVARGWGMAAVVAHTSALRGMVSVTDGQVNAEVCLCANSLDHRALYRSLFDLENVREADFFALASRAFPGLAFVPGLNFSKFQGMYRALRPVVVEHLAKLNDELLSALQAENGHSGRVSMRLGVDVSIEGTQTRSQEAVMRLRDVVYSGTAYRCEWHSKLSPNINRIHFHQGDERSGNRVVIGLFVDHLPT